MRGGTAALFTWLSSLSISVSSLSFLSTLRSWNCCWYLMYYTTWGLKALHTHGRTVWLFCLIRAPFRIVWVCTYCAWLTSLPYSPVRVGQITPLSLLLVQEVSDLMKLWQSSIHLQPDAMFMLYQYRVTKMTSFGLHVTINKLKSLGKSPLRYIHFGAKILH